MDLKYAEDSDGFEERKFGGTYQLPARSFAMTGNLNLSATSVTNSASAIMLLRRFVMERVERLRSLRMEEKLWFACELKMRSDVVSGLPIVKAGGMGRLSWYEPCKWTLR